MDNQSRSDQDLGTRNGLRLRRLGRTEKLVTELGIGGHFTVGPTKHEDVDRRVGELHHVLDQGINYWDVQWEPEEEASARVLRERGDEVVVAWPLHGVAEQLANGSLTAQYVIDYCHDHQKRYGLKRIDILLVIAVGNLAPGAAVFEPLIEGFEAIKKEGWCDYLGFSCHEGPEFAISALRTYDHFDVLMFPYNFLYHKADEELIGLANDLDVGMVAMKPCGSAYPKGGLLCWAYAGDELAEGLEPYLGLGRPFQTAVQWVLRNRLISTTVPGVHNHQQIDELVAAAQADWWPDNEALIEA